MKAKLVYANYDVIDRDTRLDVVGEGEVLFDRPEVYQVVHEHLFCNLRPVMEACDDLYILFNDANGYYQRRLGVRSMCVGDVVIVEYDNGKTDVFVCDRVGFRRVTEAEHCDTWLSIITHTRTP